MIVSFTPSAHVTTGAQERLCLHDRSKGQCNPPVLLAERQGILAGGGGGIMLD